MPHTSEMRCDRHCSTDGRHFEIDYENLARSVVRAILDRAEEALPPAGPFEGAGAYAIYYRGDFEAYAKIVEVHPQWPIYVGKAVPTGARKGAAIPLPSQGRELYRRLHDHAKSIDLARNLRLGDFTCRYLVVVPVWIPLAERFLVEHFKPVWNLVIDGFGNHDPGRGRLAMKRPQWDIVHPGRPWAAKLQAVESQQQVILRLKGFLDELARRQI